MAIHSPAGTLPEHAQKTIADMQEKIRVQEEAILVSKRAVNALLAAYNQSPQYSDLDAMAAPSAGPIRRDQFYGQPLASVVREVLTRRRTANLGPASVGEIYEAMLEGGYQFDAKDEDNAKRGLRISLAKNTTTFHRLPSGHYGLRDWYPNAKDPKPRAEQETEVNGETETNPPGALDSIRAKGKPTSISQKVDQLLGSSVPDEFAFSEKEKDLE